MSDIIFDFNTSKEEYRKFCEEKGKRLPIFIRDWYLDATVAEGAEWQVICIKEDQDIVAVFPFQYSKVRTKRGIQLYKIENTFQMVRGGLWIDYDDCSTTGKNEKRLIDISNQVIDRLPYYDSLNIKFDVDFTDWTPFYWRGFKQTTRYTYVMDPKNYGRDEEILLNSFQNRRKRTIKKAERLYTVDFEMTGDDFYDFFSTAYENKGEKLSFSYEQFHRLDNALAEHDVRIIYRAKDSDGSTIAASYTICDTQRWYDVFVAFKKEAVGARELLSWYGMRDCVRKDIVYDFEGSMIPGVSIYNREFYVKKVPFFIISKDSDKMRILKSLKTIRESLEKKGRKK